MKKVIYTILILISLMFPLTAQAIATNASYDTIKIYFFYKDDCNDCDKAKEWLEQELKNPRIQIDYIKTEENKELEKEVKNTFAMKTKKAPLIVIGSNYFTGFNNKIKNNVTKAIEAYENVEHFCNVVEKIQNKEDVKNCLNLNKGIYKQPIEFAPWVKVGMVLASLCFIIVVTFKITRKKTKKERK